MFVNILEFIKYRLLLMEGIKRARSQELVDKFKDIYRKCCNGEDYAILRYVTASSPVDST